MILSPQLHNLEFLEISSLETQKWNHSPSPLLLRYHPPHPTYLSCLFGTLAKYFGVTTDTDFDYF